MGQTDRGERKNRRPSNRYRWIGEEEQFTYTAINKPNIVHMGHLHSMCTARNDPIDDIRSGYKRCISRQKAWISTNFPQVTKCKSESRINHQIWIRSTFDVYPDYIQIIKFSDKHTVISSQASMGPTTNTTPARKSTIMTISPSSSSVTKHMVDSSPNNSMVFLLTNTKEFFQAQSSKHIYSWCLHLRIQRHHLQVTRGQESSYIHLQSQDDSTRLTNYFLPSTN